MIKTSKLSFDRMTWLASGLSGTDGVTIEIVEWAKVANEFYNTKLDVLVGEIAQEALTTKHMLEEHGNRVVLVPELSLKHPSNEELLALAYQNTTRETMEGVALPYKDAIKEAILKHLPEEGGIIVPHNLLALRHRNMAVALGIEELIEQRPNIIGVNLGPDLSSKRPEQIANLNEVAQVLMSCNGHACTDFAGPINHLSNLLHVYFTPLGGMPYVEAQVPEDQRFMIHDLIYFPGQEPRKDKRPGKDFLKLMAENVYEVEGNSLVKSKRTHNFDGTEKYVVNPYRVVERKKARLPVFYAAQEQETSTDKTTPRILVYTHKPTNAEPDYFIDTIRQANENGFTTVFLGDLLPLEKDPRYKYSLYDALENLADLDSLFLILSDGGAWENGINESVMSLGPTGINRKIDSSEVISGYTDAVEVYDVDDAHEFIRNHGTNFRHPDGKNLRSVQQFKQWADAYWQHGKKRRERVEKAYGDFYQHLSAQALVHTQVDPLMKTLDRQYREQVLPNKLVAR